MIEELQSKWVSVYSVSLQKLARQCLRGNHPANLSQAEELLSDQLVAAWTHFAASGNPNGQGNAPWPRFTTAANKPAILSEKPRLGTFTQQKWSTNHNCAFWTGNTVNGGILRFPPF